MALAIDGFKVCTKCGVNHPVSEYFNDTTKKDGLRTSCKHCYQQAAAKIKAEREAGRLPRTAFSDCLSSALFDNDQEKLIEMTASVIAKITETGDVNGYMKVMDRLEGVVAQKIEHSGEINSNKDSLLDEMKEIREYFASKISKKEDGNE